jgi:hypothetical protein
MPFCYALAALIAWSIAQPEPAMDPAAYMERLDELSHQISNADTPEEARDVSASVIDRWRINTADGIIVVDLRWLRDAVSDVSPATQWPSVQRNVRARLGVMREDAARPHVTHIRTPAAVLAEVLSRREFQRSRLSLWMDDVRRRVTEWIVALMRRLTGVGLGSRGVAEGVAIVLSIVALLALTIALFRILSRRSRAERLDLPANLRRMASREWGARALHAVRGGDLREAIRCGYHSALGRLEEQGMWRVDESRTPREYLQLLQRDDRRQPAMAALAQLFEQVWYGGRFTTSDDAERLIADLEKLGCVDTVDRAI